MNLGLNEVESSSESKGAFETALTFTSLSRVRRIVMSPSIEELSNVAVEAMETAVESSIAASKSGPAKPAAKKPAAKATAKPTATKPAAAKATATKAVPQPEGAKKKLPARKPVANATSKASTKAEAAPVVTKGKANKVTKGASAVVETSKGTKGAKAPAVKEANEKVKLPIRKPQLRILQALSMNSDRPLSRAEIAEAAQIDIAPLVEYLGSSDPARRAANDAKHFTSLITLGYVKLHMMENEPATYSLTANGKKFEQTWSKVQ